MSAKPAITAAAIGLLLGGVLGVAGSFVPSAALRGLAWGIDGAALIMAGAVLTIHFFRQENDLAAAGFLVFVAGETLVFAGSAMDLMASVPTFGAGVALWALALVMVGLSGAFPRGLSLLGMIASVPLFVVAGRIFLGEALSPLTSPLPFFAYPPFAVTLFGWAWCLLRPAAKQ